MNTHTFLKTTAFYLMGLQFSRAQLSVGNEKLFVTSGTILTVDGLSMITDGNFTMSNKTLQLSHTPIMADGRNSINRVYTFSEPVDYIGALGIHYSLAELNGNTEAKLQVAVSSTLPEKLIPGAQGTVDPSIHYVRNLVNLPLKIVSAMNEDGSLPVTLVSFKAVRENQAAVLTWATAMEVNSDHFEIQKSYNAADWQTAGTIAGAGSSVKKTSYSYTDQTASPGNTFYRLNMVDQDGNHAYSQIREITAIRGTEDFVYPNPVQDKLCMKPEALARMQSAEIYDRSGKLISGLTLSPENDVQNLSPGIYILKISYLNGSSGRINILKL